MNLSRHYGKKIISLVLLYAASLPLVAAQDQLVSVNHQHKEISVTRKLINTTQGPFWPPSAMADKDGNFIVIGAVLTEVSPGVIIPVPDQAVVVSKETVPPLDANGKEDFTNPFGAPYKVIRKLDLSPGSPDLDIVLYSNSFGPVEGDFGGGPRIPRLGESTYNLSSAPVLCPEVFPALSQISTYSRPSFPLHKVPILGFRGDQIAYDVETGEPHNPNTGTGSNCSVPGCPGENKVDRRSNKPITLKDWLAAQGKVTITLTRHSAQVGAYTAAKFDFRFEKLLPNAVYTMVAVRRNVLEGRPIPRLPDPLGLPSYVITDSKGNGRYSTEVVNPFPDPATDDEGLRIVAVVMTYRSDYQNWGSCPSRLGPGVDVHAAMTTPVTIDLTDFITKEAPPSER
jgi:hypothetical protein